MERSHRNRENHSAGAQPSKSGEPFQVSEPTFSREPIQVSEPNSQSKPKLQERAINAEGTRGAERSHLD